MRLTPATVEAMNRGFDLRYQQAFQAATPFYPRLVTEIPSTAKEEVHAFLDKIPRMREWVGERVIANVAAREFTIRNKPFELTLEVDRDDIKDDRLGIYNPMLDLMGQQARTYPDDLLVEILQNGKSALCHDGQNFFDTDHPVNLDEPTAGTQSNLFTGKALSETTYAEVRAAMQVLKGADGRPLRVTPSVLVVPPQLEFTARKILNAEANASGATNVLRGTAEVLVLPELAAEATTWYLLDLTKPLKPFVFQNREAPTFAYLTDPTDENVFFRKKFIYGVEARGAMGYALWFLAARCEA